MNSSSATGTGFNNSSPSSTAIFTTPTTTSSNRTLCRFFRANPPACDENYAELYGVGYDLYQVCYIILSISFSLYVARRFRRVWKGPFRPLTSHKILVYLMYLSCGTFLIRSIDPVGWRTVFPWIITLLCYDIATAVLVTVLIFIVFDWMAIISAISGREHMASLLRRTAKFLYCLIWVSSIICSFGQAFIGPMWVWQVSKLVSVAMVFYVLATFKLRYGVVLFCLLKNQWAIQRRAKEELARKMGMQDHQDLNQLQKLMAAREVAAMQAQINTRIGRIMQLIAFAVVCEVGAIVTIAFVVRNSSVTRHTFEDPPGIPDEKLDLFWASIFDGMQAIGLLYTVRFLVVEEGVILQKEEAEAAELEGARQKTPSVSDLMAHAAADAGAVAAGTRGSNDCAHGNHDKDDGHKKQANAKEAAYILPPGLARLRRSSTLSSESTLSSSSLSSSASISGLSLDSLSSVDSEVQVDSAQTCSAPATGGHSPRHTTKHEPRNTSEVSRSVSVPVRSNSPTSRQVQQASRAMSTRDELPREGHLVRKRGARHGASAMVPTREASPPLRGASSFAFDVLSGVGASGRPRKKHRFRSKLAHSPNSIRASSTLRSVGAADTAHSGNRRDTHVSAKDVVLHVRSSKK